MQGAEKHYDVARRVLADPRVDVHIGDAFTSLPELEQVHPRLDVIMVDLPDPIGAASRLFSTEFYEMCHRVLRHDGFLVAQTESAHFHRDTVRDCFAAVGEYVAHTERMWTAMTTYPGAFWTFVCTGKSLEPFGIDITPIGLAADELAELAAFYATADAELLPEEPVLGEKVIVELVEAGYDSEMASTFLEGSVARHGHVDESEAALLVPELASPEDRKSVV